MNLDVKWDWDNRKLPCKVKIETGNPAADELRARLREIAQRLALEKLKNDEISTNDSKKSDALRKKTIKLDSDQAIATTLSSSVYNAPALFKHVDDPDLGPAAMNINKRFLRIPKSPPRKIMMDLQKERLIRTSAIPHHEDYAEKSSNLATTLAKRRQRASRQKQVSDMNSSQESMDSNTKNAAIAVFKPYKGDMFSSAGNYSGGMLYLSRVARPVDPNFGMSGWDENEAVDVDEEKSAEPAEAEHESWEALAKELEAKVSVATAVVVVVVVVIAAVPATAAFFLPSIATCFYLPPLTLKEKNRFAGHVRCHNLSMEQALC